MRNNRQNQRVIIIISLTLAVIVAAAFGNIAYARSFPGGNHFVVGWAATRAFFSDATSPYSSTAVTRIQDAATWVTNPEERDALRFASPFYVIALYAPFALIKDYAVARGLWMLVLEVSLIAIPLMTFRLTRRKAPFWLSIAAMILTLFSYNGITSLVDGNLVIFTTLILVWMITAVDRGQDELAGILMAVATMNLQSVLLVVLFILIWAFRKQRKDMLRWFAGSLVLLIGFSVLLIPNWFLQALQGVIQRYGQHQLASPGSIMVEAWGSIGMRLAVFLSVILAGLLLREWISAGNGSESYFVWAFFLTLAMSQWIGIPTEPGNFILLLPGILFCIQVLLSRWGDRGKTASLVIIGILMAVPWIFGAVTSENVRMALMFLPMPLTAILLLYWTKWWAVRPVS